MFVCNKCWEVKERCNCNNSFFVKIDDNIYPIIKKLNLLGYKTKFCCEGHSNRQYTSIQAYIFFEWDKDMKMFDELPEGWAYDSYNYRKIKHYKYNIIRSIVNYNKRQIEKMTEEQKQIFIDKNINNLKKWVDTLPINERRN